MKRFFRAALWLLVIAVTACGPRERTIVLLSTNDMHAKIQRFAQLATAVELCRDTASLVVLVDAGDRWTGNAFVDKAPMPGMPMIGLMNQLGYDVATLGNHEFDFGQAHLGQMIDRMDFEVICANAVSDTTSFPQLPPYTIVEQDGVKIGFVGVVTNYEGHGHPAGKEGNFEGLSFPDPQQLAAKYGAELRPKVDLLVLISHMGDNRDEEFLESDAQYDLVIGGHTHEMINKQVNGTLLTQTGKDLKNIGVTVIRLKGKKIESINYRIVPLSDYQPDLTYQAEVDKYYADSELNKPEGQLAVAADKWGLANWMARVVADEADAQIGFYHIGGVRLDKLPAGDVSAAQVYGLEPFGAQIATMHMTPENMRRMILSKYNDKINTKEARRIDLISTTPYVILLDATGEAIDVQFPELREGNSYKIAVGDYVFNGYKDLVYTDGEVLDEVLTDALIDDLEEHTPLNIDNTPRQQERRK